MEVMADLLRIPLEDIGPRSLDIVKVELPVSSTCTVFAKSEVLAHVRQGAPTNDILAGLCSALATRVYGLLKRVGIEAEFVISGGIAKNRGVVTRVEQKVGLKASICFEPQIVGAVGAAIFARDLLLKQQKQPAPART